MAPIDYSTRFVWDERKTRLRTFYVVSGGLGHVPAGIRFVSSGGKEYSTARVIALLGSIGSTRPDLALGLTPDDWPEVSGAKDNEKLRRRFRRLVDSLEDAASPKPSSA